MRVRRWHICVDVATRAQMNVDVRFFFFQAEDGIRDPRWSRGLGDVYKGQVPVYEILDEEGLSLIENNAETILQEIGVEFRGDAEALQMWKTAGADIDGERVRIPKGL